MDPLRAARQAKHLAFVADKRSRRALKKAKFDLATLAFRQTERIRPFSYDPSRYADTFLARSVLPDRPSAFPERVFAIWAGENELTDNRKRNLELVRSRIGLPVELVTPASLGRWLVPGHLLHPAYEHLSLIHRSDYLRGYLMHHHGGAYVDIKRPLDSWSVPFSVMERDPHAWVTSYSAAHANWIGKLPGRMGRDILIHYRVTFGKSGFMMRSQTPLTSEWMAEMDLRLDAARSALAAHPGGVFGDDPEYPLSWTDLLGRILDPLTLKYLAHVRLDDRLLLDFEDYR
ncbi:hypothetical protein KDN32_01685 [Nocardioides sp. J2M5]|uniref:hypothetical protein n=1 Tax=Nocardioides palaemonis TaxID=2829810 RepID=UPI001BA79029|nr:hypothetical protein [Nocardioides palaemonis]MBS2936449.1 hypothetical protein [Nocardioides palaemonis]